MAASITIERYRGDTFANIFRITDSLGDPIDITGYSFALTVHTDRTPTSVQPPLFTLAGTLVSPLNGTVQFAPNTTQANQEPGTYFFDIQMTDNTGAIQTVVVGKYIFRQDITK